ncbi:MAG: mercuric reductase [Planctomycetota bacterium]
MLPHDEHNARLINLVHPPTWVNPTPAPRYNLVVIGAGTAGLVTAAGAAGLGAKVALIERDLMGGDCLNVGCVPSKALIAAARAAANVRRAGEFGVSAELGARSAERSGSDDDASSSALRAPSSALDFPRVMERLRRLRADIAPGDSASRFQSLGVDVFLGEGRFTGPDTIEVAGQTLRFKKAVIATGARAARPDTPALVGVELLTNETVFSLTELPRRLAVIGGGPIGCELAQAFARLGSDVTLIQRPSQVLEREDPDAARLVAAALEQDGVRIVTNAQITCVTRDGHDKLIHVAHRDEVIEVRADEILVGAGRTPNVDGLNLEVVGVQYDRAKGVVVDDRLRTTNPRIFAAGDVCSSYKFTHAADFMARIVIQNALFFGRARASSLTIPWCTYTSPEVAHVGLTEREAKERGIEVRAFMQDFHHVDRAILEGSTDGFVKILVKAGSDRIVGATIVAEHAGEMIGEIVLAMTNRIGLRRLAATIHPYPTVAEAIRKCGDAYNRTRLTPFVKSLFERWLAWTR